MQTTLCGTCKRHNIITRCTKAHLMKVHRIEIKSVHEIHSTITDFIKISKDKGKKSNENKDKDTFQKRREAMEFADKLIQSYSEKIKVCLNEE